MNARAAEIQRNGDLHVTDASGRQVRLHWSRFHGLIVSVDSSAAYLGDCPVTREWFANFRLDEGDDSDA